MASNLGRRSSIYKLNLCHLLDANDRQFTCSGKRARKVCAQRDSFGIGLLACFVVVSLLCELVIVYSSWPAPLLSCAVSRHRGLSIYFCLFFALRPLHAHIEETRNRPTDQKQTVFMPTNRRVMVNPLQSPTACSKSPRASCLSAILHLHESPAFTKDEADKSAFFRSSPTRVEQNPNILSCAAAVCLLVCHVQCILFFSSSFFFSCSFLAFPACHVD